MIVFPAVDIQGGKAVRLRRGDFSQVTVFGDDPVALARHWEAEGAEALHVVDLDAARTGELANLHLVEEIAATLAIPVEYGGGVRTPQSLARVAATGVRWVVVGTAAITGGELLAHAVATLGERLVVGMDCSGGMVATHGWQQQSDVAAINFARQLRGQGVRRVVYTDVARDGMMAGTDLGGLAELAAAAPELDFVASGGISRLADLEALAELPAPNVVGVIVGRALYENAFSVAAARAVFTA
jgi:phosphoribosylformimino-5-aminoimidazole carboxamide ribotide isomerase